MDFLPEKFKDKMRELLGDEFNSFLGVYEKKHLSGLRINTLKLSPQDYMELTHTSPERIPWTKNGFYSESVSEDAPSKHPYYYAGMYYIQEPSAMTPAQCLPIVPGDRVLDICAAPGGKSTELGARLKGRGVLVSNDISNSRAKALLKNVELFGIRNAVVISEAPMKLTDSFREYFDKILVDAPCSGEGMFRKSHAIISNWEQYGVEYYAKLQREILPEAIAMLKPGGKLLYSTCTFSKEEDEGTLKWILEQFPQMHVVPVIDDDDEGFKGFVHAHPEYVDGPQEIACAVRLYPHRVKGEGHFVALLEKEGPKSQQTEGDYIYPESYTNRYDENTRKKHKQISDEAFDFLEKIGFEIPVERLVVREERLFLMPEGVPSMQGLRIMRSGLLLGEIKKGRFEPSQALASALHKSEYANVYDISAEDNDIIRYLKCETISIPEEVEDGYVLVCCDSYPVGWGKKKGTSVKNKFLPGWRMM